MNHSSARGALRARTLALAIAGARLAAPVLLLAGAAAAHAQAVYPTPEAAAQALVDALSTNDDNALKYVLGKDVHRFIPPQDVDEDDIYNFLGAWSQSHEIVKDPAPRNGRATAHLAVGTSGWTLPIPLVQLAQGWRFDPSAAQDELLTRRIGRNERSVILTALAYLDAQNDYYKLSGHYAQRFTSTPGTHDGLYWTQSPGEPQSPLGPLAATMPNGTLPTEAYHGYHYRILTAQGSHAKGGARNYVTAGTMAQGCALVAWPAEYGKTGIMTFIVNQDGQVYQKNLGPQTPRAAAALSAYDPDASWQAVSP